MNSFSMLERCFQAQWRGLSQNERRELDTQMYYRINPPGTITEVWTLIHDIEMLHGTYCKHIYPITVKYG